MSAKKAKILAKKKKIVKPIKKLKVVKQPITKKHIKKPIKKPAKKPITKPHKKNIPLKKQVKTSKKIAAKALIKPKIIAKKNVVKIEKKVVEKKIVEKKTHEIIAPKIAIKNVKPPIEFKVGEFAVYPSHGIGKIIDIQKTTVLGSDFRCYLMHFEKEKLTIKIPIKNSEKIGLRPLVSKQQMDEVFSILRSGIKKLKGMWSRRAQEYESKINSGNIILLAEVLRDLTRDIEDGERSYSERIIYETAVSRLASEYCAIYKIDFEEAKGKVVITAKDKLMSDDKSEKPKRDHDFDYDEKEEILDEIEEEEIDDEEEDEDDDEDDDEKPRKKRKK